MVAYAVYLVYRSERLKKVLEAGADTIKYQQLKFFNCEEAALEVPMFVCRVHVSKLLENS